MILILISITLLIGCSSLNNDSIKMSPLPKVKSQFTPQVIWSTSFGIKNRNCNFDSNLHPAWKDGMVYVANRFGLVKALFGRDGKKKWETNLSTSNGFFSKKTAALLSGGITVSDKNIYIGSERAQVYALNSANGTLLWRRRVAGEALSYPVVSDGIVLIHTSNGMLQGLDQNSGAVKWTVNLDTTTLSIRGESAPAVAFGAAIVGGDNGDVNAIMLNDGQIIWKQRISRSSGTTEIDRLSDVDVTPIIVNNIVYALSYNGNLVALDLQSGQILWRQEIGSLKNFVFKANRIYLVDQHDHVIALDADDGIVIWRQDDLLYRKLTAPVLYNSYIVVGDHEGYLHWLSVFDGHFVSQQKIDHSGFQTDPIIAGDKFLIQARNDKVYAIAHYESK